MSVCSADDYAAAMRETAGQLRVPFVDVGQIFLAKIDAVKAGQLYPAEAQYYQDLYGAAAMESFWRYWLTTDGCHPNRVGQSLVADALADAVRSTFGR
jgi:lysophospholipase L1-like esterase